MDTYHLGVTATQEGATEAQKWSLYRLLRSLRPTHLHHGDCIGGDADAQTEVRHVLPRCRIIIHPPVEPGKRAYCEGDEWREEKTYLVRNKDIVDESNALVAMPKEFEEQRRSGTWSTVRYARKRKVPIYLILPDGEVVEQ